MPAVGGDMAGMMSTGLLPSWLRIVWAAALAGVVVVHAGHAASMPGQRRWWHLTHIVMAIGMALMYLLPRIPYAALYSAGLGLFAVSTFAVVTATVVARSREGAVNPIWVVTALDYLAMTYMQIDPGLRPDWLSYLFVAYLASDIVAWCARLFDRFAVFSHPAVTVPAVAVAPGGPGPTMAAEQNPSLSGPVLLSAHATPGSGTAGHSDLSVRITLAVMAASMAYMLAVMP
jgi:hypothetical protein